MSTPQPKWTNRQTTIPENISKQRVSHLDTSISQNINHFFQAICLQYQTQVNRQLDGQTDGQTDGLTTIPISTNVRLGYVMMIHQQVKSDGISTK